jgi:hypothetical protein
MNGAAPLLSMRGRGFKLHPQINLVLRSAHVILKARVPHLGRAPRRIARVSKDGHERPSQRPCFETRRSARELKA